VKLSDGARGTLTIYFDCTVASKGGAMGGWDALMNAKGFSTLQDLEEYVTTNCTHSLEESTVKR
jgi:hypothetical protein